MGKAKACPPLLDYLTNSLQYQMAKAMLEQIKKQQKEDAKKFSVFA